MLSAAEYFENKLTDKPYTRNEMRILDGIHYVTTAMVRHAHGQQGLERLLESVSPVSPVTKLLITADDYESWLRNN